MMANRGEESLFAGKITLLDEVNSVEQAVEALNQGLIKCPDGFCAVFSTSRGSYYLLYREGMREVALARLVAEKWRRTEAAKQPIFSEWAESQALCVGADVVDEQMALHPLIRLTTNTLAEAVACLNQGFVQCTDGYCIVSTAATQSHYLLWRHGQELRALSILKACRQASTGVSGNPAQGHFKGAYSPAMFVDRHANVARRDHLSTAPPTESAVCAPEPNEPSEPVVSIFTRPD